VKLIDAELLKPLLDSLERDAVSGQGMPAWRAVELLHALNAALVHADRIAAAERAVIDLCLRWMDNGFKTHGMTDCAAVPFNVLLADPLAKLRALREELAGDECGAVPRGVRWNNSDGHAFVTDSPDPRDGRDEHRAVRCMLPRGHEGEHEGDLGRWRWL